jgi:hypothetical protein
LNGQSLAHLDNLQIVCRRRQTSPITPNGNRKPSALKRLERQTASIYLESHLATTWSPLHQDDAWAVTVPGPPQHTSAFEAAWESRHNGQVGAMPPKRS